MAGTAVVELNQQSDSSLVAKSTRQHQILADPIPVDHSNPSAEKHAPKCNHFSIRGFVAEVRKRDPNLCDPFSLYGGLRDSIKEPKHELPPMEIPNFRWWKCARCVPELAAEAGPSGTANKEAPIIKSADVDGADAPVPLTGQTSKATIDPLKGRNSEASTSTDSNDNRNMPPTHVQCADPKGKGKAHAEDELPPPTGCENGTLKDPLRQGIDLTQTTDAVEVRRSANDEVVVRSRCNENGLTESRQEDCRTDKVEIRAPEEYVNREANNIADETREKSRDSSDAQPADALTNIGKRTDKVAELVDGPSSDGKGRSSVALPDLNECSGEPPDGEDDDVVDNDDDNDDENDNDGIVTPSSVLCEDDDDYLGADRRKTPKVRLLSELLGLTENNNDPKAKKKNPSSSVSPSGMATCKNTGSDSQGQLPMNESTKRKRTLGSQDEESLKSMEIRGLNNGNKRLRKLYKETSDSESDDKPTDQIMISETTTKRRSKLGKNPLLEKKAKRTRIDNGASSSSMSRQRIIVPRASHEKGKSSEKQLVSPDAVITAEKAVQNVNSDRVTDLPPKGNVSAPISERNSGILTKKKAKMPRSKKQTCKNHVPRECSAVRNSEEALQKRPENVQSEQIRQDGSSGKGINNFPKSYLPTGNDQICIPTPVKDGFHPLPSRAEPMDLGGRFSRKPSENRGIGETISAFRPPLAPTFPGGRADGNGERNVSSTSNAKGKQVWVPEVEETRNPRVQHTLKQVGDSVTNQKQVTTEVRGRQDIDINSIPTEDKVPEPGTEDRDDIPMEIVELLAKNQYERNRSDPKDHQHYPITLTNYGKNVRSNGNGYGENMPIFGQSHILSMPKPLATDSRNSMVNRFEEMGPSKQKMFGPFSDYNHRNHLSMRGDFRENPISARPLSPQGQDHISPYHGLGYSMGMQRSPPSFLQAMESYNRLRGSSSSSSPRPNIETRAWPHVMSSRMPVGITNSDMMSQSSSGSLNKGRAHHPSQRPTILNFNLGKQNMNFSSNGYNNNCGNPESSVGGKQKGGGSVDLYSKEAISAMHLLSLMQNAANSQPSVTLSLDGKPEILKRSMIPPNQQQYKQHCNNNNNQELGSQKTGASSSSSRQALLENNGRPSLQGGNHPCYPAAGFPFSSSLQNNGGLGRNSGFISPIPLTSRGQRSIESPHFATPRQLGASSLDKGKGIMSSPSSVNPFQGAKNSPSHSNSPNLSFGLGTKRDERMVSRVPQTEICTVNRNPSEFNDLKELSKYMIGPDDLKPRGTTRGKPGRPRGDAKKQENRTAKKHTHTAKEQRKS